MRRAEALPVREGDATHAASRAELHALFEHAQHHFVAPFQRWSARAVAQSRETGTVFYPFGGPDFLFVHSLFPQASDYVLVGNEPCPVWPPQGQLADIDWPSAVHALRHYLSFSYFITRDLREHVADAGLRGVLPLLLLQIARLGMPVQAVEAVEGGHGLRMTFGHAPALQCLHYFRQDLRDDHWVDSSALSRQLASASRLAVFLKSSSYLLHEVPFERLRHLIQVRSSVLVQDPAGLPYSLLRDWHWQCRFHGRFTADIPVFARYDQAALVQACRAADSPPLGFGFGYLTDPHSACLMVAQPPAPHPLPEDSQCAS